MERLLAYFRLLDLSGEEDDLDDELSDSLFLDALLPGEAELPDLPDDELPVELPAFLYDLEGEPDEKDSFPEPCFL